MIKYKTNRSERSIILQEGQSTLNIALLVKDVSLLFTFMLNENFVKNL